MNFSKTHIAERIHFEDDPSGSTTDNFREIGECLLVKHHHHEIEEEKQKHDDRPQKRHKLKKSNKSPTPSSSHFVMFRNQDLPTHIVKNPKIGATAHARIKYMVKGKWRDPFDYLAIKGTVQSSEYGKWSALIRYLGPLF